MVAATTESVLQPTGSPTQYEVIADAQIVGRITQSNSFSRHHNKPWVWSINLAFSDGHDPVHRFEATRDAAAMSAFGTQLVQRAPLNHGGHPTEGFADDRAGEANVGAWTGRSAGSRL